MFLPKLERQILITDIYDCLLALREKVIVYLCILFVNQVLDQRQVLLLMLVDVVLHQFKRYIGRSFVLLP